MYYIKFKRRLVHPTQILINTQQLISNLNSIKQHVGDNVKLCLPVKANAYGHGLSGISKLAEPYVDYLAVSCLDEGRLLRDIGIKKPILVFGAFDEEQIAGLINHDLEVTISSLYKAQLLVDFCEMYRVICKVHIKIDSGMNRVGVRNTSAAGLIDYVLAHPCLDLCGVYSHLAASDETDKQLTHMQIEQFKGVAQYAKEQKSDIICHLANSGGVAYFTESHFDMVRPGLLSYGYFPAHSINTLPLQTIRPCFSLITRVSYFKVVCANSGISYNHRYKTISDTRVVTLPIGYGDGYRRGLSNLGEVIIRGKKYTISGTICMDMLMVDIGADGEAYVGDEVILIGRSGESEITLASIAMKLNTIVYEVLVGFNERIPRVYY